MEKNLLREALEPITRLDVVSQALDQLSGLCFRVGKAGVILHVHADGEAGGEGPSSPFLGKTLHQILPQDLAYPVVEALDVTLCSQVFKTVAYKLAEVEGEPGFEVQLVPIDALEAAVLIRKIKNQNLSETPTGSTDQWYREILENAYDGLWSWDIKTGDVFWNDSLYRIHGLSRETFTPTLETFKDLIHPEDLDKVMTALSDHLENGVKYEIEIRQRHASGDYRYCFARGKAIRDENGVPVRMVGATIDITEQKNIELDLRETEARFRTMAEDADILISMANDRFESTYFNKAWTTLTGRPESELLNLGWADLVHPEDRPVFLDIYRRALDKRESFQGEFRILNAEGEYRWLLANVPARYRPDGTFVGFISSCIDITERKQAEDLLRESEARFRVMAEASSVMVWMLMPDGQVAYVNQRLLEFIGTTLAQVQQEGWAPYFLPDDAVTVAQRLDAAMQGKQDYYLEVKMWHAPTQEHRWILASGTPTYKPNGEMIAFIGTAIDIHDRKMAEEALKESELRLQILADNIPNMAWMMDADGWFFWYNKRWYEYTGTTFEEMQGWGWQYVHHPDYIDRVMTWWKSALERGEPDEMVFPLRGADGVYRPFLTRVTPIKDAEGKVYRWTGTNTEITEQLQLQEQLKVAKEAAESANQRKSQFLANMSHELRTPLNSVIGYGEMLQKGLGGALNEKQSRYITNVVTSGKHLLDMVNEILDLSKIESGKVQLHIEKIDLSVCMEEKMAMFAPLAKQKEVAITYTIAPGLDDIYADPVRLKQILLNLLSNAIKFNRPGGQVEISWQLATNEGQRYAYCEVRDTGCGIPQDKLQSIFSEFYQVDNSFSRQYEGTGLGLAVTKRLVELHGGVISVESIEGQGATFGFSLPLPPV